MILKIYEIQNIGKGIITAITPDNLLLLTDLTQGVQTWENTLNEGSNLISTHYVDISDNHRFTMENETGGFFELAGTNLEPTIPNATIGRGVGNLSTDNSLKFYSNRTIFVDGVNSRGIEYGGDYEINFLPRTLITLQKAQSLISAIPAPNVYFAGTALSLIGDTFNNTAPDQIVVLTQGGATTITGTYPNFTISSVNTTYTAGNGLVLTGTVFSLDNLQKVITYPTDFTGSDYTISNADNNYEIIINNGATPVNIIVPSGLSNAIGIGFTQKGTGDVSYVSSGTVIHNPIGFKIKGQYYQTYLSQEALTNIFYLGGNTKL
jgi:hypothetical protein